MLNDKLPGLLAFVLLFNAHFVAIAQDKIGPIFENGEAQIVKAFEDPDRWIRHDLWVETEFDTDGDGEPDRMHVDVTRPFQTESEGLKLPVIYNTSPYFAGTGGNKPEYFYNVHQELGEPSQPITHPDVKRRGQRPIISKAHVTTWVPRGYIVVHSSSPGTGLSDGSPTVGGENESLAPKAVIDWLCGRAKGFTSRTGKEEVKAYWSTGKVGMTGTSYNGTLPVAAACTGVEGLEAIIPVAPNTSYYHYYRSNGLVKSPEGYLGEDIDVLYDFIHSGDEDKRAYANRVVRDTEMKNGQDRITGDYNEFWAGRDYLNKMDNFKAALLMSHGFNDWNVMPEHSYRIYNAARGKGVPCQIYYHQNGHGGPPPLSMMNRWFTRYLHGLENGVEQDSKAWIVREDDERDQPTAYDDYPNPKASFVSFYLKPGSPGMGKLTLDNPVEKGIESLIDNYSFSAEVLAKAEETNHRLLYLTSELVKDLHLSGTPKIHIKAASSKKAVNLSVYLVSLPWNDDKNAPITDNIITRGWADLHNHKSLTETKTQKPGKFYDMTFDLQPDDQVIDAGQQIGLMIFSSDRDFTLRPKPGTELTIDLENTFIEIPVVGGVPAFNEAIKQNSY